MAKTNKKPNKFGFKKSKLSVLPIIFSGVLAAGALAGAGVSVWQIAKNYTESPEFTRSVKGRIKVDPAAYLDDTAKTNLTFDEARDIMEDCAKKLSRWLKDRGQDNYDVSYEVSNGKEMPEDDDEGVPQYWGYLNAQFEVNKIYRKDPTSEEEEEEKIDNDPYLSFFSNDGFNSNEKTLVYRWYIPGLDPDQDPNAHTKYTIIPFRDAFIIPKSSDQTDDTKILTNSEGASGVMYKVNSESRNKINDIYKNLALAKKESEKTEEQDPTITKAWGQPRIYIVNNLQGLYNEANYHISYRWMFDSWLLQNEDEPEEDNYLDIYNGTTYQGFAQDYKDKKWTGDSRGDSDKNLTYHLLQAHDYDDQAISNADVFNYIDQQTAGTIDANANFTNKYINEIITMSELGTYIPEKITDDYTNNIDEENPDIRYFWYGQSTKRLAHEFLDNEINYGFDKATIHDIKFDDINGTENPEEKGQQVLERYKQSNTKVYVDPSFTDTIFGGSNLVGMLSLGFLIFLVALLVILAVLYRTTGVMSWICMIFALSMTGLIATAGATVFSMSLLMGLFTMAIAGFVAAMAICGRIKRRLFSHEDTQLMIKKTFKKSLLPVVDVTVIALIFGVLITYMAPISLNAFGLILVAGAFMTFISMYLINGLLHILFLNNEILVNKYGFFGKPSNVANEALTQGNNAVPVGMDATKLEIPFYSSMSKKRIDDTGKKALIAACVVAGLLLAAIITFSVIGYTSSNMYHTSYCVAIYYDGDLFSQVSLDDLNYLTYRHESTGWWYFYTNISNVYEVASQIADQGSFTIGTDMLIQNIFGSTNQDILNNVLIALAIAASITCVYGILRYNWIAFVPMVATVFAMPLLMLGIAAASQIKFDQFVIMGFVLVVITNAIFSAGIIGAINESWSRKDAYNKEEFKFIINTALKNCWTYIWTFALAYGIFIVAFGLTSPKGLILLIGLLIIGWGVTTIFVPFIAGFLLYQFTKVRNFALRKSLERSKNKVIVNYDEIDEQEIEGLNKFTKKIPVAKETKKEAK